MKNKEQVVEVPKESKLSTIVEANIGKRLLTAIIDALFFAFTGIMLAFWVFLPITNASLHYEENMALARQYQVASHLYLFQQANDDNQFVVIEVKDFTEKLDGNRSSSVTPLYGFNGTNYTFYLEHLYYYYHSYLCNQDVELPNPTDAKTYDPVTDNFVSPHYNEPIDGIMPCDYYTDAWFMNNVLDFKDGESSYFIYDESKDSFMEKISLKEGVKEEDVVKYLKQTCYNSTGHFYNSDYFSRLNNIAKWSQVIMVVPAVLLSYGIYYITIPLIFKNGETLAKKFFKIGIISSRGFSVKKRQIVFRQLLLFVMLAFTAFIVGIGLTSLATLGIGILILLIATLISKDKRAPHDYAAMTIVIDEQKSVWFDSAEEEIKYADELEAKMAKYKNTKIIDKKVIQVGSTIIDEDVKKEFEESQKNPEKHE